mmetsp:Transcript_44609/g.103023  ORF Transcript_44609/g.103023 Transcript_44609/m.103023 type:complete len:246 (+) Transcript_44609:263-1000(+)
MAAAKLTIQRVVVLSVLLQLQKVFQSVLVTALLRLVPNGHLRLEEGISIHLSAGFRIVERNPSCILWGLDVPNLHLSPDALNEFIVSCLGICPDHKLLVTIDSPICRLLVTCYLFALHCKLVDWCGVIHTNLLLVSIIPGTLSDVSLTSQALDSKGQLKADQEETLIQILHPVLTKMVLEATLALESIQRALRRVPICRMVKAICTRCLQADVLVAHRTAASKVCPLHVRVCQHMRTERQLRQRA